MKYTHYDYLELAPGASAARIEIAYVAALERFQYGATDAGQDLSGLVRMVHAAYEILSHGERRRAYDAHLAQEAAGADQELKAMLDGQPAARRRRAQEAPEPLRVAFDALAA